MRSLWLGCVLAALCVAAPHAQTTAVLQGRVFDVSGATVSDATITVREPSAAFDVVARTDPAGRYHVSGIPAGAYAVTAEAPGFTVEIIESLHVDVGRTLVRDFRLAVGARTETLVVRAETPLVDRASATVGHVVTPLAVQRLPLNGRHFIDLGLLVPGSVAPSQTGFSARPLRGVGTLAINTAGHREEASGFLINGVTASNLTFGSLVMEPPLGSVQEFRIDNSAFSAEHGHVSGAIVNLVTRSGSDQFRGDLFEFVRNDAFDARNFFELTSPEPHRFQRHQFGGSMGGPIRRGRTHVFATYEGFRQRQGVDMNSLVPTDAERAAATDPVVRRLLSLIPRANFFDADGTARFVGSAAAAVDVDRWSIDVRHEVAGGVRLHTFYAAQRVRTHEPAGQGNSIPGFGQVARPTTGLLTASLTHLTGGMVWHEARFGRLRLDGGTYPATPLNPADFGIGNGVTQAIGLPQMIVAGSLNFGGPAQHPQGRFDTSYTLAETVGTARGRHTLRFGGEYRHFINANFAEGTGLFNFPTMAAFLGGTANAFSITLGERRSVIDQRAVAAFAQDRIAVHDRITLDLGLRYEGHLTPTEREDRFVVFDAPTASLLRVGVDIGAVYAHNLGNVEPRLGVAWDVSGDGRTVARAAYGVAVDQPGTTAVRDTAGNPPFAAPQTASGSIPVASAIEQARATGLAPATVDPALRNASVRSWNVNVQRQIAANVAATVGYMGSRGRHLRIARDINQPIGGVRPFAAMSATSPIRPGAPLGTITQVESSGYSRYQGAWVSVTRRLSRGLQLDGSYTWSRSLDTNSLNSSLFAIQNSYDIPGQYGLSDFDARHRVVVSAVSMLPLGGHVLARGWQVAVVVQAQSGNPVNIVTSNSSLTGVANVVRPDIVGPIRILGSPDGWFDPAAFAAVNRFGTLGRNVVIGPGFVNADVSISRQLTLAGQRRIQLQADVFNIFNHVNFGPPGNLVGSPTFGKISRTRLPTGEAGSSRQIQLAARVAF
jgi:hypothetical protein